MVTLETAPGRLVEQLETELGLSRDELAQALGTHPRTLERWRRGETYPQREARARLAALEALAQRLRETFATPEAIRDWLRYKHPYLGRLTPADAIRVGRFDRVHAALEAIDSGIFI